MGDMQGNEDWRILKTEFNQLCKCRHGYMLFNSNDMFVGKSLEHYGEFSEGECELFQQFVTAGDTVVEVGANIGAHTVRLSQLAGNSGAVHAFEPQRFVFQLLAGNVAINSLVNVHLHNKAAGAEAGSIDVPLLDPRAVQNFGGLGLSPETVGEKRPMITLDSMELPKCKLLKVDVEGMEIEVLKGARDLLQRCKPILYLENDRKDKSSALIQYIKEAGYQPYWHLPPMYDPNNYRHNQENVFGRRIVSVNILCVREDANIVINGLKKIESADDWWQ